MTAWGDGWLRAPNQPRINFSLSHCRWVPQPYQRRYRRERLSELSKNGDVSYQRRCRTKHVVGVARRLIGVVLPKALDFQFGFFCAFELFSSLGMSGVLSTQLLAHGRTASVQNCSLKRLDAGPIVSSILRPRVMSAGQSPRRIRTPYKERGPMCLTLFCFSRWKIAETAKSLPPCDSSITSTRP
jgi:hypothetical protein